MLQLKIPDTTLFDEKTEEFMDVKGATLQLEHSLISISKWESKWEKPFFSDKEKTRDEILDYVKCMSLSSVNPDVYLCLNGGDIRKINEYINAKMSATWFSEDDAKPGKREVVTSELIYYWMIVFNIPYEYQKWHINRLLTLIRICSIKNQPPKKRSRRELLSRNAALNEARRKKYNTKG